MIGVLALLWLAPLPARAMLYAEPDDRTLVGPGGAYGIYTIVSDGCLLCLGPMTIHVPISADQLQWFIIGLICVIPITTFLSLWFGRQFQCSTRWHWLSCTFTRRVVATAIVLFGVVLSFFLYKISREWLYTESTLPAMACAIITAICIVYTRAEQEGRRFRLTIIRLSVSCSCFALLILTGIVIAYEFGEHRRVVLDIPTYLATGLPRVLPCFILLLLGIALWTGQQTVPAEQPLPGDRLKAPPDE